MELKLIALSFLTIRQRSNMLKKNITNAMQHKMSLHNNNSTITQWCASSSCTAFGIFDHR